MEHADTLSQVALVLAMAFAGEALLRKLQQPALLGYIFAGIILGPSVLGVVHNDHQIAFMAELGILLLLFIIGLELDLRSFARIYKIAMGTAAFQIGASLIAMTVLGLLFGWPLARILLLGFAVSLSSTAVAITLLDRLGGMESLAGRKAVGILVAQDLAVIPMLLIIGAFGEGRFNPWELLKIIFAVAVMAGVINALIRRNFVVRVPDKLRAAFAADDSQSLIIKGLACCFTGAALSGALGLSASYGAFLAGLLIGSTQDHKKIETHARPVFDILMMVFFLSVGLLIDLRFVAEFFWPLLAILIVLMLIKTVVTTAVLMWFGIHRRQALLIGSVLGQIGEFSFVLAAMGMASGAINAEGYKFAVTLIAMSLIFTPLWMTMTQKAILFRRRLRRGAAENQETGAPNPSEAAP